jgi:WD40 repeat protein
MWQFPLRLVGSFCLLLAMISLQGNAQEAMPVPVVKTFPGHTEAIYSVSISPDGKLLATGSFDKSIKLFDLATGKLIRTYSGTTGHQSLVLSVAFSKDGFSLASGGSDNSAKIWDVPLAVAMKDFVHPDSVAAVSLPTDGKFVASGSKDGTVKIWNPVDGKQLFNLVAHPGGTLGVAVAPNGQSVVSVGKDQTLKFWTPVDGKQTGQFVAHSKPITGVGIFPGNNGAFTVSEDGTLKTWQLPAIATKSLATLTTPITAMTLSNDDSLLLAAGTDKSLKLLNAGTGQLVKDLAPAPAPVKSLLFGPNATSIAGTTDGKLCFWNQNDGKLLATIQAHSAEVTGLVLHPNGTQFVSSGGDGLTRIWTIPVIPTRTIVTPERVTAQTLSSDQKRIITGGADKIFRTWVVGTPAAERQFSGHTDVVTGVAMLADGSAIISTSMDGTIRYWTSANGQQTALSTGHDGAILDLALAAQNNFFATAGADGFVKIWQLPATAAKSLAHPEAVEKLVVSPDGSRVLTYASDKQVRSWTMNNQQFERAYTANGQPVTAFACGSDGNLVAIGGGDKSLVISSAGKEVKKLTPAAVPTAVSFSPNGAQVVAGLQDNSLQIFNQPEGKELKTIKDHQGAITTVQFSPKGDLFFSGSADKTVRIWNAADGASKGKVDLPAPVSTLAVSRDGTRLGILTTGKGLTLWNLAENKAILTQTLVTEGSSISFNLDATRVAIGHADQRVRIYGLDGKVQESFVHDGPVTGVGILADGKRFVSSSSDKSARVWTSNFLAQAQQTGAVKRVLIHPQGTQLFSGGADKQVRILDAKTGKELKAIPAHEGEVNGLSFSADGTKLATTSSDKTAKIWNLADGKTLATIPLPGPGLVVGLSPNATRLAVAFSEGNNHLVRVFEGTTGKELQTLWTGTTPVRSLQFLADNHTLAISGDDKSVNLLDANAVASLPTHPGGTSGVAIHPTGTQLLTSGKDKWVKLWDVASQKEAKSFGPYPEPISNLTTSRDFTLFAVSFGKSVKVIQISDGKEIATMNHPVEVLSLNFNPDRSRLVTGGSDQLSRVWEVTTGHELQAFNETGPVRAVIFSPTQPQQVVTASDKSISQQTQSLTRLVPVSTAPVRAATITPSGSHFVATGDDLLVHLINASNGSIERKCEGATAPLRAVSVSKNGQLVASGGVDKSIRLYNFNDAKLIGSISTAAPIRGLAFHPTLPLIAGILEDGKLGVWNINFPPGQPLPDEFGRLVQEFAHPAPGNAIAFSETGLLFTGSDDKTLKQWRIASDAPVKNFAHPNLVDSVAFNHDGTQLATGCHDGILRTWDVQKGPTLKAIQAHTQPQPSAIYSVAWTGESKQLATASFDKTAKLYDVASSNLVKEFKAFKEKEFVKGHRDQVFCVALNSNGKVIATGSSDKTIKLWNADDGSVIREFKNPNLKQPMEPESPEAHPGWVYAVRFSSDDKYLVSAGSAPKNRGYLAIWSLADGKMIFGSELPSGPIYSLALTPDGTHAALGCGPRDRRVPASEAILVKLPK